VQTEPDEVGDHVAQRAVPLLRELASELGAATVPHTEFVS